MSKNISEAPNIVYTTRFGHYHNKLALAYVNDLLNLSRLSPVKLRLTFPHEFYEACHEAFIKLQYVSNCA